MADDRLWTPLHSAALSGHHFILQLLLKHGADVQAKTNIGATPLHLACQSGYLECVESLTEAGAVITAVKRDGAAPIHMAAQYNHHKIVEFLIAKGCSADLVSSYLLLFPWKYT